MSFDTIKNYIRNRLEGLGYSESSVPFNFEDAPSSEFDSSFILSILEGTIDPDGENLNTRLYDNQIWQISIAFSKSSHNDIIKRDDMYRGIEAIIKDLDNPSNYIGTVRYMRYSSWEVEENEAYFLLRIAFEVQDQYTY